ncbi:MAG: hypothetical protein ABIB46_02090 [bacterium]
MKNIICFECKFYKKISEKIGDCFGFKISHYRNVLDCPEKAFVPKEQGDTKISNICENCYFYQPSSLNSKKGICYDGHEVAWNKKANSCPQNVFKKK